MYADTVFCCNNFCFAIFCKASSQNHILRTLYSFFGGIVMAQTAQQRNDRGINPANAEGEPPRGGKMRKLSIIQWKRFFSRSITVTVSMPKAVFSVFFSLFILVWVFIFGIMLGRGHNPEEAIPELAKVMPPATSAAERRAQEPVVVLQRRDLQYHESLKGKNAGEKPRVTPPSSTQPKPATATAKSSKPAAKPSETPKTAPAKPTPTKPTQQARSTPAAKTKPAASSKAAPSAKPPQKTTAGKAITDSQDQTLYNYVYQVAAVNNSPAAESVRKKLQNNGISAAISKSESKGVMWHRIMVSFKGRPEDTRKLRDKLSSLGINNIILRKKTPIK